MKWIFLFLFGLLFLGVNNAYAHPLDNSDTYIYIYEEIDNQEIDETEIIAYVYINWLQSSILVENQKGIIVQDVIDLLEYQPIYNEYVNSRLKLLNDDRQCKNVFLDSPVTQDQISLSLGTRVIIVFKCDAPINNLALYNDLFLEFFDQPSNYISVFKGQNLLHSLTLGKDNKLYEFNASDLVLNPKGDESKDFSLGYTDEDIFAGDNGNTLSREYLAKDVKQRSFITRLNDLIFMRTNEIKNQSFIGIVIFVFLLGFLHTIEAGHSKVILASSMINKKMNIKSGFLYSGIFTLTHLADIVIVGILFVVADNFLQIFSKVSLIEKWAGYALLITAIFILIKNTIGYFKQKELQKIRDNVGLKNIYTTAGKPEFTGKHSLKEQILLGFLTGLAPCIFGWTIFMLVLSTGQSWWIFPVIISFGLGIFLALIAVVLFITVLKNTAYGKFQKIAEISPLISGLLLFFYALFIIL